MVFIGLKIDNIGPINEADIELGKLNIVGGVNSSGKSTVSRLFYCFLLSASPDRNRLYNQILFDQLVSVCDYLKKGVSGEVDSFTNEYTEEHFTLNDLQKRILSNYKEDFERDFQKNSIEDQKVINFFSKMLKKFLDTLDINCKNFYLEMLESIDKRTEVEDDLTKYKFLISEIFVNEFDYYPYSDEYGNGRALFSQNFNQKKINWELGIGGEFDKMEKRNKEIPEFPNNIIYIDSISPLEVLRFSDAVKIPYHFKILFKNLSKDHDVKKFSDNEYNSKITKFLNKIDQMLGGKFKYNSSRRLSVPEKSDKIGNETIDGFEFIKNDKTFHMKNSSSGLKQIGTIQMLLNDRLLNEGDFLIIDEPEVNLHPEWQIKLAEILILLVKDLNITVYLNSHSPHFIEALEVLSVKHGIKEDTRFYLSAPSEDDEDKFDFVELGYDNIDELYDNLGDIYDMIEDIRIENMMNMR